jgi:hypothetical protein
VLGWLILSASAAVELVTARVFAREFKLFSVWRFLTPPVIFKSAGESCVWSTVVVLGASLVCNSFNSNSFVAFNFSAQFL